MSSNYTRPIICKECREPVWLAENERGSLLASCDCGNVRNVKVTSPNPEEWV